MKFLLKVKKLIKSLNKTSSQLEHHAEKSDDIYCFSILQPLLIGLPYLPFNGGALRPFGIAYILNEIIINQRKFILEFGSGLSTIMMARLIKKNNLNSMIYTIEHNHEWACIITNYLKNEDLLQYVKIIKTDLKEIQTSVGKVNWYEKYKILSVIKNEKFDLIIIDGPPANAENIKYSRYPGLTEMFPYFDQDFCLILDDSNREGEREIISTIKKIHGNLNISIVSNTLAVVRVNTTFNPIPVYY